MTSRTRISLLLSAGAAATAVTVAVAPTAAFAAHSGAEAGSAAGASAIKAAKKAKISAKGAAVRVPITYKCNKGWSGYLTLQLVEVVDDGFASGFGGRTLSCTGLAKTVSVYVQANTGQGAEPFEPGAASLLASIDSYNPDDTGCGGPFGCPPIEGAKPAGPPPGETVFTQASVPTGASTSFAPNSERKEIQRTITLVDG